MTAEAKTERKIERFSFVEFSDGIVAISSRKQSGKGKEEAPPPPPTFNEEQLKEAEKASYQKGFLAGEQEGRKQAESEQAMVDRKLTEIVEKFATRVSPIFSDYRNTSLALQQQMPKAALAIARKVAGHALAQNAQAVIDEMALRCCEAMMKEPKLAITVHESMGDTLARKVEQLAERLQSAADIVILRDPNMPPADFRIEWNQGGMERQTADIWQQVEKLVEDMAAAATRDAEAQIKTVENEVNAKPDPAQPENGPQDPKKE